MSINKDDLCFLYSILAHIHPIASSQNPNRVSNYTPFLHELDYSGLTFPLKLRQIRKFEEQNPNISVNVLYQDEETYTIMPLRVTKHRNRQHHVNLFLLYDDGVKEGATEKPPTDPTTETPAEEEEAEPKYHYTLVRNLSALTSAGYEIQRHPNARMPSTASMYSMSNGLKSYETHLIDCKIHKPQVIELPDPDDVKEELRLIQECIQIIPRPVLSVRGF